MDEYMLYAVLTNNAAVNIHSLDQSVTIVGG